MFKDIQAFQFNERTEAHVGAVSAAVVKNKFDRLPFRGAQMIECNECCRCSAAVALSRGPFLGCVAGIRY